MRSNNRNREDNFDDKNMRYCIRCLEDGAILPNKVDGKPRTKVQAQIIIDDLHNQTSLHYEMIKREEKLS